MRMPEDSAMAKWTREMIIRDILRRESAGLSLIPSAYHGADQALYQAGSRIFGSWRNAVIAAGIAPDRAKAHERWPPGKILSIIRSLSRRRRPLRREELQERYGQLIAAARRIFGSWSKAVIVAGVDPLKLRRVAPWSRERIIEAILKRALNSEPLGRQTTMPRSLADAGARVFGDWGSALMAAGIDPKRYVCPSADSCRATATAVQADNYQRAFIRVRYANRIPTLTAVDRELFLWLYRIGPTRRSPAPCEN
ncbi:MAG: hypothetical protein ABSB74_18795, partial [Tepidisphaeraceae bacterium]